MSLMETGRICIKTSGRTAGKKVVILSIHEKGFAVVSGIGMKKKRCNFRHLFPTQHKIHVSKNSTDTEISKQLKEVKLNG